MAEIILDQVHKRFGPVTVVESMSLTVRDGEFVVFVGPSGCGKSTTLRMIAGLEDTSGGTISIGGRDVTNLEPKDRNIAMVFQNYALYPHKSVYENLAFGMRMRKTPKHEIEQQVKWAAQMLGIEKLLDRKPRQLSGGQMQRVSLGRALVRRPDAFLLDEPLSNLDAKLRVHMREELGLLHKRIGTSMVYVTHDQIEAMTLGDRIVVMHGGKAQQIGTPLEIYDSPANIFVAGFLGAPEMNFIEGDVILDNGRPWFRARGRSSTGVPTSDTSGSSPPRSRLTAAEYGPADLAVALPSDRLLITESMLRTGAPATLGIRPEHVRLCGDFPGDASGLRIDDDFDRSPSSGGSSFGGPSSGGLSSSGPTHDETPVRTTRIAAEIRLIEQMGAQTVLVCGIGPGQQLRVLCERLHDVKVGSPCNLSMQMDRIHLFSKETGASLLKASL